MISYAGPDLKALGRPRTSHNAGKISPRSRNYLAKAAQVSSRRIQWWIEHGLIRNAARIGAARYTDEERKLAQLIAKLRERHWPIERIKHRLPRLTAALKERDRRPFLISTGEHLISAASMENVVFTAKCCGQGVLLFDLRDLR